VVNSLSYLAYCSASNLLGKNTNTTEIKPETLLKTSEEFGEYVNAEYVHIPSPKQKTKS
jgi:hypothetical protein